MDSQAPTCARRDSPCVIQSVSGMDTDGDSKMTAQLATELNHHQRCGGIEARHGFARDPEISARIPRAWTTGRTASGRWQHDGHQPSPAVTIYFMKPLVGLYRYLANAGSNCVICNNHEQIHHNFPVHLRLHVSIIAPTISLRGPAGGIPRRIAPESGRLAVESAASPVQNSERALFRG
ncbi:hypothetical protein I7I51_08440 [Histoplasma capsulatum]|uniref:Uncharacterized protein n=1 Tax=Ajellomyces capsulatus TaxID=5037 RepID=A0A8A1LXV8_AJECA|nr:hypothetical protein I7I51_08440 [Histoplasma capsulatum]